MQFFGLDTAPQSFCYSFITLSIICCSRSIAQKFAIRVCEVATVVMENAQLVLSQFKNFFSHQLKIGPRLCESAARRYFCRDVGIFGRRRSVGGQRHKGSRCRNWPSPNIPKHAMAVARVVQLSFSSHPPYTPSTIYRTHGYTGLQSHTEQTGLLQLSAVRCSSQQHSGSAASTKQCSRDRSPSCKTISCPAITAWAALVAHSTQNRVQGGCVDLQESQQRHSTDIHQSNQIRETYYSAPPPELWGACDSRLKIKMHNNYYKMRLGYVLKGSKWGIEKVGLESG